MKVLRLKRIRKILQFYQVHFNIEPPYRVIVEGSFIRTAVDKKLFFREMLPKILQAKVVPVVTRCLVAELKKHPENSDIALMAKRLEHIPCSHGDAHVSAAECIASVVAENATAEVKYFVATQNNDIQQKVKHMIGVPLLFWYNNILTLHEPSQFQQWFALQQDAKKGLADEKEKQLAKEAVKQFKLERQQKLRKQIIALKFAARKQKKAKGPNPLSVKKKKKKPQNVNTEKHKKTRRKRKRRSEKRRLAKQKAASEQNQESGVSNEANEANEANGDAMQMETDTPQCAAQSEPAIVDENGNVTEPDEMARSAKRRKRYRPRVHKRRAWKRARAAALLQNGDSAEATNTNMTESAESGIPTSSELVESNVDSNNEIVQPPSEPVQSVA